METRLGDAISRLIKIENTVIPHRGRFDQLTRSTTLQDKTILSIEEKLLDVDNRLTQAIGKLQSDPSICGLVLKTLQ